MTKIKKADKNYLARIKAFDVPKQVAKPVAAVVVRATNKPVEKKAPAKRAVKVQTKDL